MGFEPVVDLAVDPAPRRRGRPRKVEPEPPPPEDTLSIEQVAAWLHLNVKTVRAEVAAGRLRVKFVGPARRTMRFRREWVIAFLESGNR
jgi:excisionase family DNA binding protein